MNPHEHLKQVDPIKIPKETSAPFYSLVREITFQQLAGKAANAIFSRLESLANNQVIPKVISKLTLEQLRAVGLSWRKAEYIKDLATHFLEGKLKVEEFHNLSNKNIREKLIDVKGIGPWTSEMFLMFHLHRKDVFSPKDLGLHKAICKLYKKEYPLKEEELIKIAEKWKPYRTYAYLYLWKSIDEGNEW